MKMYDLIKKKRDGGVLSKEEIYFVVEGYTKGTIPDYQMSSMLMAIYFQGLDKEETVQLTLAMAESGEELDLQGIQGVKVDKHSTGGVGDKTSLIIGPMLASLGIPVAKMSGRGLGHTGGTIDKLESIPGFKTEMGKEQFIRQVNDVKLAIAGQTANLAPADKKLYALRDVTATVDNYSLIAASIMSKKLAAGADVIVLDVKTGSGAFMQTEEEARILARTMVDIGNMAGRKTYALITDMNEPLGSFVGNALEVYEVIQVLQGGSNQRLYQVAMELASYMLLGVGYAKDYEEARTALENSITSGAALESFVRFVEAQGGDASYIRCPEKLLQAKYKEPVYLQGEGYLNRCNTSEVGMAVLCLGGGRETKESEIDLSVGIELCHGLGDYLSPKEPLAYIYGNDLEKMKEASSRLSQAYTLGEALDETKRCITYGFVE